MRFCGCSCFDLHQRRRFEALVLEGSRYIREREFWDEYMRAFEEAVRATASKHAPWFVVPADNKWFARLVVMGAIVKALDGLKLAYPQIDPQKEKDLVAARAALAKQK
jgi:polyphosphate kinase 2 PPK2